MKKILFIILIITHILPAFARQTMCLQKTGEYKIVKDSTFPFTVNNEKACFFAFYIKNPHPIVDVKGNGNSGDTIWYGYYKIKNPTKIQEFPKPLDTDWTHICSISAISFYPLHSGNKKRDVTIIGSCDRQNAIDYNFPLVFEWKKDRYVLDKDVYLNLHGMINLTIADIREYIRSPNSTYKKLESRYNTY
ncbi:MAG: hypothetical protein PSV35_06555 [bacterium]|nr:hypothetical protein [bacterium]